MRLYDYAASANCCKVRLLLALLGRVYERVPVDIFAGETLTDAFAELNPVRETPVLELDSGAVVTQSNARNHTPRGNHRDRQILAARATLPQHGRGPARRNPSGGRVKVVHERNRAAIQRAEKREETIDKASRRSERVVDGALRTLRNSGVIR